MIQIYTIDTKWYLEVAMLDHKDVLQRLVNTVNGDGTVSVRETNFGYVIRSEKVSRNGSLRGRVAPFVLSVFTIASFGVWFVPLSSVGFATNLITSSVLMLMGYLAYAIIRSVTSGFELHVDTNRRELRAAVLTTKGDSWIRSSARFSDITDVYLRNSKPDMDLRSLCMRVIGDDDVMPVAVGSEKTLLALHKRLMRDLRPMEERLAVYSGLANSKRPSRYEVFPQIGPDELPG